MLTRRQFLKLAAIAGASTALPMRWLARPPLAYAFSQSQGLKKFVQSLRGVGGSGIPVASPDTVRQPWWQPGVTHYTIDLQQYTDQLHPDMDPTHLWGYGQNNVFRHLGGIIVAQKGQPVQITFRNNLPDQGLIPVDRTDYFMDAMKYKNDNRVSVHLHGGFTPWLSDGEPAAWWDPHGNRGPSFQMQLLNPHLKANEGEIYYTNDQTARLMWYHDHAMDITRINAYAGLATAYVITDDFEAQLTKSPFNLPGPVDARTVYMVFQDKIFNPTNDPTWPLPNKGTGDLWYPHNYDVPRWDDPLPALTSYGQNPSLNQFTSIVPEYFGDTPLVNGLAYPSLVVEQRQYRFRMLNANQARFLNPRLVYADHTGKEPAGGYSKPKAGPAFIQIGTEGGFLPFPAMVNGPKQNQLLLAPAERADLIVDFRNVPAGTTFLLYNDAPAPYPMGDEVNDYYPGNPDNPVQGGQGTGPNSRTLMQITVKARVGAQNPSIFLPPTFVLGMTPLLVPQIPGIPNPVPRHVQVRQLTLNEVTDWDGRLIQMLGTTTPATPDNMGPGGPLVPAPGFGRMYMSDATEVIQHGSTEVWEVINLTGDVHPIHLHLVNFQVLSRQPAALTDAMGNVLYTGGPVPYTGSPVAPDLNELGWKETVRMYPNQVTRIIAKFDLPNTPFKVPFSNNPNLGVKGYEYVWHCHILEHEEHDMMRPLVVI